jgi:hypothetical protein
MALFAQRREKPLQRVGIVLAAYRPDQQLFEGQLESIRRQDHSDWFCIVTLDSPKLTVEEAPWIRRFYADHRFHFHQNETRLGARGNFERGSHIALEHGAEAIAFSDQDDFWYPNKVSRSLFMLNQRPPLSAVCCDARVRLDGVLQPNTRSRITGEPIGNYFYRARLALLTYGAWGNGMMFDAELARLYPFNASRQGFHDGHITAVASVNGGSSFFPDVLFDYNIHHSNVVGIGRLRKKAHVPEVRRSNYKQFAGKWNGARMLLRDAGWRFAPLRFLLSTYVGTMALVVFLLIEQGYQYQNPNCKHVHGLRGHVKAGLWILRKWIIPRTRIYTLLFSRRRSALPRRS